MEDIGSPVRSVFSSLRPVVAGKHLSRLLAVRAGTPLQHIEQVDFDELGNPVMASSEWHVPDVFELCVSRRNDVFDR